jgi:DNA polymerase-3 subunit beta
MKSMPVEVAVATGTAVGTMEITVSKGELLRELTATQGVVERKTTIPILSNYLFEAADGKLSLTATDLGKKGRLLHHTGAQAA